jgi:hypothetical protein
LLAVAKGSVEYRDSRSFHGWDPPKGQLLCYVATRQKKIL